METFIYIVNSIVLQKFIYIVNSIVMQKFLYIVNNIVMEVSIHCEQHSHGKVCHLDNSDL